MIPCLCEPIFFENIPKWNEELKELLQEWEEMEQVMAAGPQKLLSQSVE